MTRLACQADPGSGPCPFVSVRTVHGTVPDAGYPPESPMGRYCPGEPIVTFTCVVHLDGVHAAMQSLGLRNIHAELLPADVWAHDGRP